MGIDLWTKSETELRNNVWPSEIRYTGNAHFVTSHSVTFAQIHVTFVSTLAYFFALLQFVDKIACFECMGGIVQLDYWIPVY